MRVQAICVLLVSVGAFVAAQDLTTNIKVPARTLCQTTRTSLLSDPACSPGQASCNLILALMVVPCDTCAAPYHHPL